MWIFVDDAFVSVVQYHPEKDKDSPQPLPKGDLVLVRARVEADLDSLRPIVPNLTVQDVKAADYRFRTIITKRQLKKWLTRKVDALDYDSHFKEVVRDRAPNVHGRYSAMMAVWSAMNRLQPSSWTPSKAKPIDEMFDSVDEFMSFTGTAVAKAAKPLPAPPKKVDSLKVTWKPQTHSLPTLKVEEAPAPQGKIGLESLAIILKTRTMVSLQSSPTDMPLDEDAFELWCLVEDDVDHGVLDGTRPIPSEQMALYVADVRSRGNLH